MNNLILILSVVFGMIILIGFVLVVVPNIAIMIVKLLFGTEDKKDWGKCTKCGHNYREHSVIDGCHHITNLNKEGIYSCRCKVFTNK